MKLDYRYYFAPIVVAGVLGCGDSTSPNTNNQNPNAALSDLGTMNIGDVRVMTFAQAQNGLTIPSAEKSAVYAIITANVAGDTGSVPQFTVLGDWTGKGQQTLLADNVPSYAGFQPRYTRVGGALGAQFEQHLRAYERSRIARFLAHAQGQQGSSLLRRDNANLPSGIVPDTGTIYQFHVPGSGNDPCDTFSTVSAKIVKVSTHAIIAVDTRTLNNGFTQASYDSLASEFDTYIYPTDSGYFGAPTDIDHNGHIYILYTPEVNLLTPPHSDSYVGGFTFAGDFISPTGTYGCPESNQAEIFYLMVPDATGQYNNVYSTSFVRQQTRVTMAHEFQHAINSGNRIVKNDPILESAWLDEALSSLGEDAVGRAELALPDLQTIDTLVLKNLDTSIVNTFFLTNFGRTQYYAVRPDTIGALVTDNREEQDIAAFGAGWAFLRYVDDWYSPGSNPRTLTTELVAGPDSGQSNLTSHTGASLDTLLAHWLITMYTDSRPIANLPMQYNYRSYHLREIIQNWICTVDCNYTWLPVHQIGDETQSFTLGIPSSSADYYVTTKTTTANGGARTIQVNNLVGGGGATYPSGRIYVVRLE